jgi:hypothetical protein
VVRNMLPTIEAEPGSETVDVRLDRLELEPRPTRRKSELRFDRLADFWLCVSGSVLLVDAPESVTSESVRSRTTEGPAPGDWAGNAVASGAYVDVQGTSVPASSTITSLRGSGSGANRILRDPREEYTLVPRSMRESSAAGAGDEERGVLAPEYGPELGDRKLALIGLGFSRIPPRGDTPYDWFGAMSRELGRLCGWCSCGIKMLIGASVAIVLGADGGGGGGGGSKGQQVGKKYTSESADDVRSSRFLNGECGENSK